MAYTLIIAEKPNAAQKIADALADSEPEKVTEGSASYYRLTRNGQEIIVVPAVGHLFLLAQKKGKGWDYPVFDLEWVPTYTNKDNYWARKYFDNIEALATGATEIVAACDYDIEGSTIAWNIISFICVPKADSLNNNLWSYFEQFKVNFFKPIVC